MYGTRSRSSSMGSVRFISGPIASDSSISTSSFGEHMDLAEKRLFDELLVKSIGPMKQQHFQFFGYSLLIDEFGLGASALDGRRTALAKGTRWTIFRPSV